MEVRFSRSPLSLDEIRAAVRGRGLGGTVLFFGSVRGEEAGRPIDAIDYEAYEGMALKELEKLARRVESRHGARVAVFHRLGRVPAGDDSVLVAAAAVHRAQAFSACRELIDGLKEAVPIWKVSFCPAPA